MAPRRGEIHWAEVTQSEARGSEMRAHDGTGFRPYVIVSDGRIQTRVGVVIGVPLSTSALPIPPGLEPFRIEVRVSDVIVAPGDVGMPDAAACCCDQVRPLAPMRLRAPVSRLGKLSQRKLAEVENRLQNALGLNLAAGSG